MLKRLGVGQLIASGFGVVILSATLACVIFIRERLEVSRKSSVGD